MIINPGASLTVSNDVTLLLNNPKYYASPDYLNVVKSQILVYGTLNVGGDLNMTNTSYITDYGIVSFEYIGSTQLVVGSTANPGTLNVTGDLNMLTSESNPALQQNNLAITYGTVNFNNTLNLSCASSSGSGLDNYILSYDVGTYAGLQKDIYFNADGNPLNVSQGVLTSVSNGDYSSTNWHLSATTNELTVDSRFQFGILYVESPLVSLNSNLSENNLLGKLIVKNGSTLLVDNPAATLSGITGANKVELEAGATLKFRDNAIANGLPANGVLNANPNSIVDFDVTGSNDFDVLASAGTFPIVTLSGSGTKTISAASPSINNSTFRVGEIRINEGTLTIESGAMVKLNNSYGSKTLLVNDATTLKFEGSADMDVFADIHRNSTTEFASNSTQSLFSLPNASAETEPYGILKLTSGTGGALSRTVGSDELLVENRLEVGNNINLNLNNNGYIHLLSDVQYTAYVAEVPASASINYSGTGNFIVDKYMGFTGYTAADVAHPIAGATLENYKNNGVSMGGFPGSNSPGQRFASVSTYTESELGGLNTGFNKPESIDDSFLETDGASRVTRSTYRMNIPAGNIHLSDTGNVNTGDYTFKITFNFSDTDADSRTANDGYNLIGNPFPANLDWSKVVNDPANKPLFDNGYILPYVYVYKYFDRVEQEPTGTSGYGYYNPNTNFQFAQDSIIPSHQGFWVKAFHPTSASETYELVIRESHKIDFEESRNYKNGTAPKNTKDIAAKISLESAGRFDQMYFHTWKKANLAFDKALDIKTYGAKRATSGFLDFADENNERLELYVNAVPENLNGTTLPIYTNIAKPGTHTLTLSNLSNILKNYSCSYILDTQTSEKTSLTDSLSISFTAGPFAGVRFVLVFNQDLSAKITTENLSCEDANNGRVEMNLTGIAGAKDYSLFLNGANLKNYTGTYTKILEENLAPGNYQLVNNSGLITCSENTFDFVIANAEPLVATIDKSLTDVFVNDRVSFNANGNADVYNWVFKGVNYPGATFVHTFQAKGKYTLKLQYADKTLNCADETSETIEVQELATGISTALENEYFIIANGMLSLSNDAIYNKAVIYSLNGQVIETVDLSTTKRFAIPTGATLIQLIGDNQQYVLKIAH